MNKKMLQCCGIKLYTQREKIQKMSGIIIKNKKEEKCILIDVAVPAERNIVQKEAEKKIKCKSLCIEIQGMWTLKYKIIPVII